MQWRTHALMNHQPDRGTHTHARIQYVNGGSVLCVKPVQDGGCAHANDGVSLHEDVECSQAAQQIWLLGRVDAMPHAQEFALLDLHVELLTTHDR
jgi:hypothetical protein